MKYILSLKLNRRSKKKNMGVLRQMESTVVFKHLL